MIEPHINEKELQKKIIALFDYRLFPQLMESSPVNQNIKNIFLKDLIRLQTNIYHLDAHLEANWEVNEKILNLH